MVSPISALVALYIGRGCQSLALGLRVNIGQAHALCQIQSSIKFTASTFGFSSRRVFSDKAAAIESTLVSIPAADGGRDQIGTRRPKHNINRKKSGVMSAAASNGNVGTSTNSETRDTDDAIIWIDCEMTGLDVEKDEIMEVACIITGPNLEEIARQPSIVLHVSPEKLGSMVAWCVSHHGESGLTEDCKKSQVTIAEAEKTLLTFVQKHTRPKTCPVGGNSICMDRVFLQKYMPSLYSHFHYRSIDVSTIKELVRRWYPREYNTAGSRKRWAHRTMNDIEDSINELRFYKSTVFKQTPPPK